MLKYCSAGQYVSCVCLEVAFFLQERNDQLLPVAQDGKEVVSKVCPQLKLCPHTVVSLITSSHNSLCTLSAMTNCIFLEIKLVNSMRNSMYFAL